MLDETKYNVTITKDHRNVIQTFYNLLGRISINGEKTWIDNNNQDGIRPVSITMNLFGNEKLVDSQEVTPDDDGKWFYVFKDLQATKNNTPINYEVKEVNVPEYIPNVEGFNIVNTHVPEIRNIGVEKVWVDADNQYGTRPDNVTINLLADGEVVKSVVLSSQDDWSYKFTDLPVYQEGKKILYTITENTVDGYSTVIKDFKVTNSRTFDETIVNESPLDSIPKTGDDSNNGLFIALMALSLFGVGGIAFLIDKSRRRKSER